MLYTYQGSGTTFWHVPLYDIFGSTVELVDASNPGTPVSLYKYDPYGVPTYTSTQRPPWPFLYHGMEQEYPDSWKLYWEPNGNVYNPDPFQLPLSGPQGLGSGGSGPRGIGGGGGSVGGGPLFAQNSLNQSGAAFTAISVALWDTPSWPVAVALQTFAYFFPDFFGGGEPEIPSYVQDHTRHGPHAVAYNGIQNIVDQSPSASGGGGGGRPLGKGDAPSPSQYEQWGRTANFIQNWWNLWEFHRGGTLDAQHYGGSRAYGNYVFGVYMAAHGYTLPETLNYA